MSAPANMRPQAGLRDLGSLALQPSGDAWVPDFSSDGEARSRDLVAGGSWDPRSIASTVRDGSVLYVATLANRAGAGIILARIVRAFAEAGREVLLIDADVSRPLLAKPFQYQPDEGLVDMVLFGTSAGAAIRRTATDKIRVLTVGSPPVDAVEIWESKELAEILVAFRSEWNAVVVHAPFYQGSDRVCDIVRHADALVLAMPASGVDAERIATHAAALGATPRVLGMIRAGRESEVAQAPAAAPAPPQAPVASKPPTPTATPTSTPAPVPPASQPPASPATASGPPVAPAPGDLGAKPQAPAARTAPAAPAPTSTPRASEAPAASPPREAERARPSEPAQAPTGSAPSAAPKSPPPAPMPPPPAAAKPPVVAPAPAASTPTPAASTLAPAAVPPAAKPPAPAPAAASAPAAPKPPPPSPVTASGAAPTKPAEAAPAAPAPKPQPAASARPAAPPSPTPPTAHEAKTTPASPSKPASAPPPGRSVAASPEAGRSPAPAAVTSPPLTLPPLTIAADRADTVDEPAVRKSASLAKVLIVSAIIGVAAAGAAVMLTRLDSTGRGADRSRATSDAGSLPGRTRPASPGAGSTAPQETSPGAVVPEPSDRAAGTTTAGDAAPPSSDLPAQAGAPEAPPAGAPSSNEAHVAQPGVIGDDAASIAVADSVRDSAREPGERTEAQLRSPSAPRAGNRLAQEPAGSADARPSDAAPSTVTSPRGGAEGAAAATEVWGVHVSSFPEAALATDDSLRWSRKQYLVTIVPKEIPDKGLWYRIVLGRFSGKAEAQSFAEDLRAREGLDYVLVMKIPTR
jgi:hypothetical protein